MDRIVIIVGAGASLPFFEDGLSTNSLTATVCDKQRWADLLSRYDVVADGADQINQRAVFDLLDKLAGLTGERNFEDYIEIIDKIASYGFDRSDRKILHAVIKLLGGLLDCYPMHTWTKAPFLARQLIAEEVGRAHETS